MASLEALLRHPALFITGTDTGVGKTITAVNLTRRMAAAGLEVCAVKPIASGGEVGADGHFLAEDSAALGVAMTDRGADLLEELAGVPRSSPLLGFPEPIAPWTAANNVGQRIDFAELTALLQRFISEAAARQLCLIIEGAGGALVPLGPQKTFADLIAALGIPAVLVGRTALGTINHTLLSVEALQRRGIPIAAVVLSRQQPGPLDNAECGSLRELAHWLDGVAPLFVQEYAEDGSPPLIAPFR